MIRYLTLNEVPDLHRREAFTRWLDSRVKAV